VILAAKIVTVLSAVAVFAALAYLGRRLL